MFTRTVVIERCEIVQDIPDGIEGRYFVITDITK